MILNCLLDDVFKNFGGVMKKNRQLICDYMHYAALYDAKRARKKSIWYQGILADSSIPVFNSNVLESVRDLLSIIISDQLNEKKIKKVKIGVSSGMDSRGILSGLLDVLPRDAIYAYTNGEPGNPDFENARSYTEKVLPNHLFFEQTAGSYSAKKSLNKIQSRVPGTAWQLSGESKTTMPPHIAKLNNFHGFLGDSISGKRLKKKVDMDWAEAVESFVSANYVFKPSKIRAGGELDYHWLPDDYDPFHIFPLEPFLSSTEMLYYDQLDLFYRQEQRIRHGAKRFYLNEVRSSPSEVQPILLRKRNEVMTVYDDIRWQKSFLLLSPEFRIKQKFLKEAWAYNFPDVFRDLTGEITPKATCSSPSDSSLDIMERIAKTSSHTNWERQWETNDSFRDMVRVLFYSLSSRKLIDWFEPIDILREIEKDHKGLGREIFGICSLELGIQAGHLPAEL